MARPRAGGRDTGPATRTRRRRRHGRDELVPARRGTPSPPPRPPRSRSQSPPARAGAAANHQEEQGEGLPRFKGRLRGVWVGAAWRRRSFTSCGAARPSGGAPRAGQRRAAGGAPLWRQGSPSGAPLSGRAGLAVLWGSGCGRAAPASVPAPREESASIPPGCRAGEGEQSSQAWWRKGEGRSLAHVLARSRKCKRRAVLANVFALNKRGVYSQEILKAEQRQHLKQHN